MVSLSHIAPKILLTACIGWPSTTRNKQLRSSVTVYAVLCETDKARSRAIHSHSHRWIVCMTARLDITPKTTEQNGIVRSGKSEAEVTNNKILHSRYCTIEANYWQTRSLGPPLYDSRARPTCIHFSPCDVMHKHCLCRRAVSVRLGVCHVPVLCQASKHMIKLFSPWVATPF